MEIADWVKQRQDDEPERIVGDGQQQQKRNGWMAAPENRLRDEIAECDVGRAWDGPAAQEEWLAPWIERYPWLRIA